MKPDPIRFALVGYGAWGGLHARAIADHPGAELAAICAPSEESRQRAAADFPHVGIHANHQALLAQEQIDIVDVVTPSHTHLEIGRDVFQSGRHLLLEKPMATTVEDCKELIQLAARHQTHFAVGHEFRLSSQWGRIKSLIEGGAIGEVRYVLVELSRKPYRQGSSGWRYDRERVGSWVLEEPIHFFDLARWYLSGSGEPSELYAYGNSIDSSRADLYDNFSAMFRYDNGSYAVVSQTLAAFEHHQTIKVTGTQGAIWAGWSGALDRTLEPDYFLKLFRGNQVEDLQLESHSGEVFELRQEIDTCVRMVRGECPPAASGEDGLWSAGLCLLAEESIRQGQPLPVGDLLRL